jgi:hypothetical protein
MGDAVTLYDWHCCGCGHVQTSPRHPAPRECLSGLGCAGGFRGFPARGQANERDRQEIALRAKAPKRADPGRVIAAQADAGHLPLFVAANEPTLL